MKKMLIMALLVQVYAQLVSAEVPSKEHKRQAGSLGQFEAAKQDPQFLRFVDSFEKASEKLGSYFGLPANRLDYFRLGIKNLREQKKQDNSLERGLSDGYCWVFPYVIYKVNNYRLDKERKSMEKLNAIQKSLQSDLEALTPAYLRCKTLQPKEQEECIDAVRLNLYNLHENYFKQEQRLFPHLANNTQLRVRTL